MIEHRGARAITAIETSLLKRGSGKNSSDPIRIIRQFWSLDGELLAEIDPYDAKKDLLEWLNKRGGLGSDVHEAISRVLGDAEP